MSFEATVYVCDLGSTDQLHVTPFPCILQVVSAAASDLLVAMC